MHVLKSFDSKGHFIAIPYSLTHIKLVKFLWIKNTHLIALGNVQFIALQYYTWYASFAWPQYVDHMAQIEYPQRYRSREFGIELVSRKNWRI